MHFKRDRQLQAQVIKSSSAVAAAIPRKEHQVGTCLRPLDVNSMTELAVARVFAQTRTVFPMTARIDFATALRPDGQRRCAVRH